MAASTETRLADLERSLKNAHNKIARLELALLNKGVSAKAIAAATAESEAAPAPKAAKVETTNEAGNVGYYYSADLNKALYIDKNGKFWRIQADGKRGEKPIKPVDMDTYAHIGLIAGPASLAKKLREGGDVAPAPKAAVTKVVSNVKAGETKPKVTKAASYDDMDAAQLRDLIVARKGNVDKIVEGTWARGRAIAMRDWLKRYDMRQAAKAVTASPKTKGERGARSMG